MLKKAISIFIASVVTVALGIGLCGCGSEPQTATITLKSNQTTGYAWVAKQTVSESNKEGHCFEITDEYVEPEDTGGLVGVPGEQVFTLKPLTSGKVDVTLTYCRSWEPSDKDDTVTYTFEIDDDLQIECVGKAMEYDSDKGSPLEEYESPPEPVIE